MVTALFTAIGDAAAGVITVLTAAFGGIEPLFYSTADGITILGSLLMISVGIGFVGFAFRFVISILKSFRMR